MQVSLNSSVNYCNYKCQNNTCFGMQKRQATKFRELFRQNLKFMSFRFGMIKTIPNKSQIVRNVVGPKGPVTSGLVKAQELNAEFYQLVNKTMEKGYMNLGELRVILLKHFIPKKLKLYVQPVNILTSGSLGYFHRFKDKLYLGVKANKDGAMNSNKYKIKEFDIQFMMHETFHLFVSLLNLFHRLHHYYRNRINHTFHYLTKFHTDY